MASDPRMFPVGEVQAALEIARTPRREPSVVLDVAQNGWSRRMRLEAAQESTLEA